LSRDIDIDSCKWISNAAGSTFTHGDGGAIFISTSQRFALRNSFFANNSASSFGGAIYADQSSALSIGGLLPTLFTAACSTCANKPISASGGFEYQRVDVPFPSYVIFGGKVDVEYLRGTYLPSSMQQNWINSVISIAASEVPGIDGRPPLLFSERGKRFIYICI